MRLATFVYHHTPSLGIVHPDGIVPIPGLSMLDVITHGAPALADLQAINRPPLPYQPADLLAPIPEPKRNVMCVGLNYLKHAEEGARAAGRAVKLPPVPMFFTKATHAVNGPYANIPYDVAVSTQIDWEVELGVVIGKRGKNISAADAFDYVFGYTVVNDISARDLQNGHGGQFFKGKSLDGACPMGPWIVTADEISDPHNLPLRCRVNGVVKQDSNTNDLIFKIPTLIESLSRGMTLEPGDVLATGTPQGVGFARTPPEFLKPGDVVECEVEGIGVIRNTVG
jgi:2-keto-4-pentenoate hydratase/2-oxohepta-3-ene-1,7-dioic acid hydratase in catechol pathway